MSSVVCTRLVWLATAEVHCRLGASQTHSEQEGAAVEGPPAMGPSLQLSTDRRRGRPLSWQRGHPGQGGKGSLRHLPNIKLIGQQAEKLWRFFANNAISCRDLDLWPIDLVIGPGVLVSQGPFLPSFEYVGLFVFPLGVGMLAFGYGRPTPATAGILEIGPRGAGVPGTLSTKFRIRRSFRFPSRWRHAGFRVRSAHPSNSWEPWNWSTGCSCLRDPSYQVWSSYAFSFSL